MKTGALIRLLYSAALASAMSCSAQQSGEPPACNRDSDCAANAGCVGGVCLPQTVMEAVWAVELSPKGGSGMAFTQLPGVRLAQDAVLQLEDSVSVPASFDKSSFERVSSASGGALALRAMVLAKSAIIGRPRLQFDLSLRELNAGPETLDLWLPRSLQDSQDDLVTVRVVASSPTDALVPPFSFEARPAAGIVVALPVEQEQVWVEGTLASAIGQPLAGYKARLWPSAGVGADNPLSTVTATGGDGSFRLAVWRGGLAAGNASTVAVEFVPPENGAPAPRFVSNAFSADPASWQRLQLKMAPYINPSTLRLKIVGRDSSGVSVPLAGAAVRFRTTLTGSANDNGTTVFVADGQSGADGVVELQLIPGSSLSPQLYEVRVIPAVGSSYGSRCFSNYSVGSSGNGTPSYGPDIELSRQVSLSGVVWRGDGKPARDVSVQATRAWAPPNSCGDVGASASALTDRAGFYLLHLEPGRYTLEVDPPSGSAMARLTVDDVNVEADTPRDISLPAAGMLDLRVVGGQMTLMPETNVRVYRIVCSDGNAPPCFESEARALLAGQGQSDAAGKVRLVLPSR